MEFATLKSVWRNRYRERSKRKGQKVARYAWVLPPRGSRSGRLRGTEESSGSLVGELKEEKRGSVASRCRRAALTCLVHNSLVRFAPTRSFVSDHGRTNLFSSPLPSATFHLRTIALHHVSFSTFFLPSGTLFSGPLITPTLPPRFSHHLSPHHLASLHASSPAPYFSDIRFLSFFLFFFFFFLLEKNSKGFVAFRRIDRFRFFDSFP